MPVTLLEEALFWWGQPRRPEKRCDYALQERERPGKSNRFF